MTKLKISFFWAIFMITSAIQGQSTVTGTSAEFDSNLSGNDNITRIKLFGIEFNGSEVPINLIYNHSGIKVRDEGSSVGLGWQIEEPGIITQTVNFINDSEPTYGWFNTSSSAYLSWTTGGDCNECIFEGPFENDISPDYFSLRTADGNAFDFMYKRNSSPQMRSNEQNSIPAPTGNPSVLFLSNENDYKVKTTFSNFITDCTYKQGNVFEVKKNDGTTYNFINGPVKEDLYRNNPGTRKCRNDFYLESITNPSNDETITFEYFEHEQEEKNHYSIGSNGCTSQSTPLICDDFQNNVIRNFSSDYFFVDKTRFDIKKIITKNNIIKFNYFTSSSYPNPNKQILGEIEIFDINNNFITGYTFIYGSAPYPVIETVEKYDKMKFETIVLYKFEYFDDYSHHNQDGHYEDYFGYDNGEQKYALCPLPRRIGTTYFSGENYEPNIVYAKNWSISKIVNKFGGSIEFDYQLNRGIHSQYGPLYAGGLILSSKKISHLENKSLLINYSYSDLIGFSMETNSVWVHYMRVNEANRKWFSQIPSLRHFDGIFPNETVLNTVHTAGDFFKTVTETAFDGNTLVQQYKIKREYIPNPEGVSLGRSLKHETFYNSTNEMVKKVDYTYDYATLETVNAASYSREVRGQQYVAQYTHMPININKIRLTSLITTEWDGGEMETLQTFGYIGSTNKVRNITAISPSTNSETIFSYADDSQMSSEPVVSSLISNNMVGIPLQTVHYNNSEKTLTTKTLYDISGSTFLAPKTTQEAVGTNNLESLSHKTYDPITGKPVEEFLQNDNSTIYIWGYNKTKIIAKIVNATLSEVQPYISNLQTLSDSDTDSCINAGCTEEILRVALNSLRNALPNSMITTFTYDPVIGITSLTDPRGDRLRYIYDDFGQLVSILDKNENILSETQIRYYTQN